MLRRNETHGRGEAHSHGLATEIFCHALKPIKSHTRASRSPAGSRELKLAHDGLERELLTRNRTPRVSDKKTESRTSGCDSAGGDNATGGRRQLRTQAALRVVFATWVAIASINAGDRQS